MLPFACTEDGDIPFFSPDGAWLGFHADGWMKKVPVGGGAPFELCPAQALTGAFWAADDSIYFAPSYADGLHRLPASGGPAERLTTPDRERGEAGHGWPWLLPDGRHLLFTIERTGKLYNEALVAVFDLETGTHRVVVDGGTCPRYVAPGFLLFARADKIFAAPFDAGRCETTGPPAPLFEDVLLDQGRGVGHFDFGGTGPLVFVPASSGGNLTSIVEVDHAGRETAWTELRAPFSQVKLSPDGQRLALTIYSSDDDLWLLDRGRDTLIRLTYEGENDYPVWSPAGRRIAYSSYLDGKRAVAVIAADAAGAPSVVSRGAHDRQPTSWSPDGGRVLFDEAHPSTRGDIWVLSPDGGETTPWLATRFDEHSGAFSPDGSRVAYVSDETGQHEVFVRPFADGGSKRQVSRGGGTVPVWSRTGDALYFRSGGRFVIARTTSDGSLLGEPEPLLDAGPYEAEFDTGTGGGGLIAIRRPPPIRTLGVLLDWRRRLGR